MTKDEKLYELYRDADSEVDECQKRLEEQEKTIASQNLVIIALNEALQRAGITVDTSQFFKD